MNQIQATNFNRHSSHHDPSNTTQKRKTTNLSRIALSIIASSYLCSLNANPQATQNQSTQNQLAQNQAHSTQHEQPAQAQTMQTTATSTQDLPQSQSTQARQEAQASHTEQAEQGMQTENKAQDTQEPSLDSTQSPTQATQSPSLDSTQQSTDTPPTPHTPAQPKTPKSTQSPIEIKELDRVVTTGSALASDIASIPGNVSIIDSKAISTQANTKITDIISKQAGVHIDNNASFNPRPKVKIRGINYGTLVLLDGVILSDLEGEARILNQIFLNEVERVEIARGASSAVYGTGAIGGVINFITAMPKKLEIKASAGYGSAFIDGEADRNVASAYLSVGNAFLDKKLKVKIHGGFKRSEVYANSPSYVNATQMEEQTNNLSGYYIDNKDRYIIGTTGEREVNIYDIGIKASYELGERDELSATFRFSNHNYDTKNYKTYLRDASGNPTYTINNQNYFIGSGQTGLGTYSHILASLNYLHSFDDGIFRIQASSLNLLSKWQDAENGDTNRNFSSGKGRGQDIDTSNNYLDFIYEDLHYDRQKFTLGAQFRYHHIVQTTPILTNWRDSSTRSGYHNKYGGETFIGSIYGSLNSLWVDSSKYGKFGSTLAGRFDNWVNFDNYIEDKENAGNAELNKRFATTYLPIFSPNLALHYTPLLSSTTPQNLTLKTSVGYGFRMPTMREKYYFNFGSGGSGHEGREHSPNLKHEQALSFEIGAEYQSKWINTSLYFYNIEMFDMIYQTGDGSNTVRMRRNAGRARINGIEYTLEIPIYRALAFGANYTLTNTQFLTNTSANPNQSTKGNALPAIPKHSANFSLSYAPKYGFYGSLWAHYTSAFFYDDANTRLWGSLYSYDEQFTLNAKAGYAFANGIDISAQFLNMTNNRYWDYYIMPGASFYLQIGYKL
ncbi:TonB-dependent receptor domain-containing protein [Helicobacter sp. MIT 01-3238]|uniref:TonB-dependent receptor domain-containing protein n=1 Tax=Helicobacter sp. MIT 01-3238 TaxID=398627 RepID=UPI000E1F4DBF|nr:TonB-dependent receptor [Helicobacter sp. MIT 01-3238]RDU54014.1 hypothetical protein CQA40_04215 [Helicobacter sp. MIT 01-3238]